MLTLVCPVPFTWPEVTSSQVNAVRSTAFYAFDLALYRPIV